MQYYIDGNYTIEMFNRGMLPPITDRAASCAGLELKHDYPLKLYNMIVQEPGGYLLFEEDITGQQIEESGASGHIFTLLCKRLKIEDLSITFDGSFMIFHVPVSLIDLLLVYGINLMVERQIAKLAPDDYYVHSIYDPNV